MNTEKTVQKRIVLKVNDRDASQWKTLMTRLGEKELPKLVRKWEALELGKFSKDVLIATATGSMNSLPEDAENYVIAELKKKYTEAGVVEMLHPSLLTVARPEIEDFVRELANFKGRFDEQRDNILGINIAGTGVLMIENLPLKGDKIDISNEFIQDIIDKYFTTYIENPTQERLYRDSIVLAKQIQKVAANWKIETGGHRGMDVHQFINELFNYDIHDGSVTLDIDNIIWFLSFVKEEMPVG